MIRPDGSVYYWGEHHVEKLGFHTGWLPRAHLGAVAEQVLQEDGYSTLDEYYRAGRTDQATVITSVVIDGQRKVVEDYGREAPDAAQELVEALTMLQGATTWDPEPFKASLGGRDAPSCTALRERAADACFRYNAGEASAEMCRLYADPAEAALHGSVPPELCTQLLRSFDLAPLPPGIGAVEHGPVCTAYLESASFGCRDTLLGRPVPRDTMTCRDLVYALRMITPDPPHEADGDEEGWESIMRINDLHCERWMSR